MLPSKKHMLVHCSGALRALGAVLLTAGLSGWVAAQTTTPPNP